MTDREKAIATLAEHLDHWKRLLSEGICTKDEGERIIYALTMAIKALEQEPKTGYWILTNKNGVSKYVCSECNNEPLLIGESYPIYKLSDYCPYCGAKMVEPQESEE